ncbi:hypothetical protein ACEVHA_028085 [Klebsiella pneumoniae]
MADVAKSSFNAGVNFSKPLMYGRRLKTEDDCQALYVLPEIAFARLNGTVTPEAVSQTALCDLPFRFGAAGILKSGATLFPVLSRLVCGNMRLYGGLCFMGGYIPGQVCFLPA